MLTKMLARERAEQKSKDTFKALQVGIDEKVCERTALSRSFWLLLIVLFLIVNDTHATYLLNEGFIRNSK